MIPWKIEKTRANDFMSRRNVFSLRSPLKWGKWSHRSLVTHHFHLKISADGIIVGCKGSERQGDLHSVNPLARKNFQVDDKADSKARFNSQHACNSSTRVQDSPLSFASFLLPGEQSGTVLAVSADTGHECQQQDWGSPSHSEWWTTPYRVTSFSAWLPCVMLNIFVMRKRKTTSGILDQCSGCQQTLKSISSLLLQSRLMRLKKCRHAKGIYWTHKYTWDYSFFILVPDLALNFYFLQYPLSQQPTNPTQTTKKAMLPNPRWLWRCCLWRWRSSSLLPLQLSSSKRYSSKTSIFVQLNWIIQ